MKNVLYILCFMLSWVACEEPASTTTTPTPVDSTVNSAPTDRNATIELPESHDCTPRGELLEGNKLWLRHSQVLISIVADSSTYDENFGESHRILRIYDTGSCNETLNLTLPVNRSPDFPYYLADINYNNTSKLVAIQGFDQVYSYDVEGEKLIPAMRPAFLTERELVDAQSGMIQRLELWEDYLVGYAQDLGAFVFDLRDKTKGRPVLPMAEFTRSGDYHSLFFLESESGKFQAFIPSYARETDVFNINPLFQEPVSLSGQIPRSARNNRFIVLNQTAPEGPTPIAIDMQKRIRVELPADISDQKTQDILKWLRENS